jgi:hypothetical protein
MILDRIFEMGERWGAILHALAWVAIVVWVLRRPADEIFAGAPNRALWRDLRWWVLPLAAIQVTLYFVF